MEDIESAAQIVLDLVRADAADMRTPLVTLFSADSSPNPVSVLSWRLWDAFRAVVDPSEIHTGLSARDLGALVVGRSEAHALGLRMIDLFRSTQNALGEWHGLEPVRIRWTDDPMSPSAGASEGLRARNSDRGYDDLIRAIDENLGARHGFLDSIWHKLNLDVCELMARVGGLVNYLWRLRISENGKPVPRFEVPGPAGLPHDALVELARRHLLRLLSVMALTFDEIRDSDLLDMLFLADIRQRPPTLANPKHHAGNMRNLLDFELRTTFGVSPGDWHERVFGDLRMRLPPKIATFGALVRYVVRRWENLARAR